MPAEHPNLRSEHYRVLIALLVSALAVIAVIVGLTVAPDRGFSVITILFLGWDIFGIVYASLTLRVFGGASQQALRDLLTDLAHPGWYRHFAGGADGPGFSVPIAAVALAAAALLPQLDSIARSTRETLFLTVLIVLAVIMSLVVVTLTYAVHYARLDIALPGMSFPGGTSPGFLDYLYFSCAVATTFGTTDVEVTSSRLRRAVIGHSVLTFVFNTVIIALLVSALTG